MPDHVHMLVSTPPKMSVSSFMGYLKDKNAPMMCALHASLKYRFGNGHRPFSRWPGAVAVLRKELARHQIR